MRFPILALALILCLVAVAPANANGGQVIVGTAGGVQFTTDSFGNVVAVQTSPPVFFAPVQNRVFLDPFFFNARFDRHGRLNAFGHFNARGQFIGARRFGLGLALGF